MKKKFKLKKFVKQHWPELTLLSFFAAVLLVYFLYLKTAVQKELIYFEIQVLSQEREELLLRNQILDLKQGDTNPNGRLTLEQIKYFSGLKKDWMIDNDYVRAKIRFSYLSDNKQGLYYYGDQELKIGQEILLQLNNTSVLGRVTHLQKEPFVDDYVEKQILVRFREIRTEFVPFFREIESLSDNNGFVYASVIDSVVNYTPKAVVAGSGRVLAAREPYLYDIDLLIKILVEQDGNDFYTYDGTRLSLDETFSLNNSFLRNFEGRITDVQ